MDGRVCQRCTGTYIMTVDEIICGRCLKPPKPKCEEKHGRIGKSRVRKKLQQKETKKVVQEKETDKEDKVD